MTKLNGLKLKPGDVVVLHLGVPTGAEAGLRRPAIVVTALHVLQGGPSVVQVVPLTSSLRDSAAEVRVSPDRYNNLDRVSAAQCQHIRSVATSRIASVTGNVGSVSLEQIRGVLNDLIHL